MSPLTARTSSTGGHGKSVRFETDECDQVKIYVKTFEKQTSTSDLKLWWSREEMEEILGNVRSLLERYGFVEDVSKAELNEEARGLEHHLAPDSRARRAKVIQGVICGQHSLCRMDADKRARLLGTRYSRMSKPSALLARTLAERDARAVSRQ